MNKAAEVIYVSNMDEEGEISVWLDPDEGGTKYVSEAAIRASLPDDIEIYRTIKKSGSLKRGDIAKVVASLFDFDAMFKEPTQLPVRAGK